MLEVLKKYSTLAIQDDYKSWVDNDRNNEMAKLLLIDQADYNT
jgi:hypothetical protein